ncbi:hypothetical protein HYH03_007277 [Edaphochlamys debaryana]|uniref:SRCR domain-containing protein n=1 Tax=Edaphochlamys debaryana TaxID=47281 RepID=A0A835YBI7_9CHLO|nr:hypothetical protein HYH03_007277 [Edaphochlamys debaryana]|eukprot:KAG2494509.1 hypothetical protein HYH03_007277 [Edaphochlamys debaryana]
MPCLSTALVAALLLSAEPYVSPYSVRLSGGPDPSKGRVEVIPRTAYGIYEDAWTPFCDSSFSDDQAATVCGLLGYNYGRKYFAPAVTFPTGNEETYLRVSEFGCDTPSRRHLRGSSSLSDKPRRVRKLLEVDEFGEFEPRVYGQMPMYGTVATSQEGLPECFVNVRRFCEAPGHLAGAECSDEPFETAPPPMDLPPSPPPPPPSKSPFANYVSGTSMYFSGAVEPNLCTPTDDAPSCPGRAELLVADPSDPSQPVWAPLCGFDQAAFPEFAQQLARHFCNMAANMPAEQAHGQMVFPSAGEQSYAIPTGPVTEEGYFDPSKVRLWASLPQPSDSQRLYEPARLIQDSPGFTVSAEPCPTGRLFTVDCSIVQAD